MNTFNDLGSTITFFINVFFSLLVTADIILTIMLFYKSRTNVKAVPAILVSLAVTTVLSFFLTMIITLLLGFTGVGIIFLPVIVFLAPYVLTSRINEQYFKKIDSKLLNVVPALTIGIFFLYSFFRILIAF